MSDPSIPASNDFISTSSGLSYRDDAVGDGAEPVTGRVVTVHYTGWLSDAGAPGRKFDSSRDRGTPFSFGFGAGEVISGWRCDPAQRHPDLRRRAAGCRLTSWT